VCAGCRQINVSYSSCLVGSNRIWTRATGSAVSLRRPARASPAAWRLQGRGALYRGHRGGTGCPQASSFPGVCSARISTCCFAVDIAKSGQRGDRKTQVSAKAARRGAPFYPLKPKPGLSGPPAGDPSSFRFFLQTLHVQQRVQATSKTFPTPPFSAAA
jgi:hypothetical protein